MNTLVFFMSMLSSDACLLKYDAGGFCLTGTQTNEAAAKYLIRTLADKGEKLDRIIAITSRQAKKSALDVFSSGIREFCGESLALPRLITVDTYDGDNELAEETVLADVMGHITSEDIIYLDVSGGKRTDTEMMMLLLKLVRYKGIRLADAVYSAKGSEMGTISSHNAFYRNLDILDGVNQFAVSGKATQLAECFEAFGEDKTVRRLLGVMEEFSSSITLCSTAALDDILKRMKPLIKEVSESPFNGMEDFLFRQLIPVISSKFFGESDEPDYCQIILWCLENHLIQQAVTLYVEKMPKYLFEKGLIRVTDEIKEAVTKSHGQPEELNLEKELFFSKLMDADGLSAEEKEAKRLINELIAALQADSPYEGGNERVLRAIKSIMYLRRRCIDEGGCRMGLNSLLNDRRTYKNVRDLAEFLYHKGITCNPNNLKSQLKNDEAALRVALNLPPSKEKNADYIIEKKVNTIKNVMSMKLPDGFTIYISREELRMTMLGYLYARGIRNRINHASDKNNSTDSMEKLLIKNGFDIAFKENTIINQLKASVGYISALKPAAAAEKR